MPSAPVGAAVAEVPPRLVKDLRIRALTLWVGLRLGLLALGPFTGLPSRGLLAFIWVEVLAVVLVQADLRVCRETFLLANLGVSRLQLFAVTFSAVLLPEALAQTLLLLLLK